MQPCKYCLNNKCLTSVGIVLALFGIILLSCSSNVFNKIIDNELTLTPEKHTYGVWKKTPMPITMDFYFFNWLNPEEVLNPNVKPRLEERGPYVFREVKEKVDIVWNDNGTVTYKQLRYWYFDEEKSNGSLSDEITTLNAVAVTAAAQSGHLSFLPRRGLSMTLRTIVKDIHITKTVGELLFDGYSDTLIDFARKMPRMQGVDVPPFERFGWFYGRNGSTAFDGIMNMGTGTKGIPLGRANYWNFKQYTGFYEGECGRVKGSAGELYPPYLTKDELYMFSADMCRSLGFQFDQEIDVKGINGYRFIGGQKTLDNGTKYPENLCFCGGECVPSGVLNVTSCRYGAPGFISFPHYYQADPYYLNQFEGLHPDREKHEFSLTLEPRTGIPLSVSAKFQINILMTPNSDISLYNDAPRLFFPMLWFRQEVLIPDDMASSLRQLINLPHAAKICAIVMIVIGGGIVLTLLGLYFFRKTRALWVNKHLRLRTAHFVKETQPLNEPSNADKTIIVIKPIAEKQKAVIT